VQQLGLTWTPGALEDEAGQMRRQEPGSGKLFLAEWKEVAFAGHWPRLHFGGLLKSMRTASATRAEASSSGPAHPHLA
ncbi:hypothetical protein P7K49_035443, partial [Saguinus oedipus]